MNGSERIPAKTRKVPSGVDAPFSSLTRKRSVWPSGKVQVPRWIGLPVRRAAFERVKPAAEAYFRVGSSRILWRRRRQPLSRDERRSND